MAGFRPLEIARQQMVLWAQRLEDAVPADRPVRQVDRLLTSAAFAATFQEWAGAYVLLEGQPPYQPRDLRTCMKTTVLCMVAIAGASDASWTSRSWIRCSG